MRTWMIHRWSPLAIYRGRSRLAVGSARSRRGGPMATTGMLDRTGLDRAVAELRAGADRWSQLPSAAKRELLLECHSAVAEVASEWVERNCPAGEHPGSQKHTPRCPGSCTGCPGRLRSQHWARECERVARDLLSTGGRGRRRARLPVPRGDTSDVFVQLRIELSNPCVMIAACGQTSGLHRGCGYGGARGPAVGA